MLPQFPCLCPVAPLDVPNTTPVVVPAAEHVSETVVAQVSRKVYLYFSQKFPQRYRRDGETYEIIRVYSNRDSKFSTKRKGDLYIDKHGKFKRFSGVQFVNICWQHRRRIYQCGDCNGKGICVHKRNKWQCRQCKYDTISQTRQHVDGSQKRARDVQGETDQRLRSVRARTSMPDDMYYVNSWNASRQQPASVFPNSYPSAQRVDHTSIAGALHQFQSHPSPYYPQQYQTTVVQGGILYAITAVPLGIVSSTGMPAHAPRGSSSNESAHRGRNCSTRQGNVTD